MSEELDLLSDNRPIRYVEVGDDGTERVIYRASSIGTCERALVATARKALAQPHPEWFQKVLDEGTAQESTISDMWDVETQIPTVGQQAELNLLIGEIDGRDVYVRAHVDGFNGNDPTSIREYKKFRDSTWGKFLESGVECNPNYPWQVSIAMHALNQQLVADDGLYMADKWPAVEFVGGHFAGDDTTGRTITEVHCKHLATPPIPLIAIRKKIARIERLINEGWDIMEVACNGNVYPCAYWRYHDPKEDVATATISASEDLLSLISAYQDARTKAAAWRTRMAGSDAEVKALRGELLERFAAQGVEAGTTVTVGNHVAKWTETVRKAHEVKESVVVKLDITSDISPNKKDKAS